MKSVSPKHGIALICATVPITMLILALSPPRSGANLPARSQAAGKVLTGPCRVASARCKIEMKPQPHFYPLIDDMMRTAVSIADRL
jgi:hypothetical protein